RFRLGDQRRDFLPFHITQIAIVGTSAHLQNSTLYSLPAYQTSFSNRFLAFQMTRRRRPTPFIELRLAFGTWLALALELQLGADILATTLNPSFDALAKLAIVAVVRTFLNYFLNKELQEETELQRRAKTIATPIYSKEQEES
ncbi:MAG: DUF1622 domain-containing protein, partial [Chroococcidiopsidaceae cyanobacterium CP_BM_RX_35]|nr:DUF1622 domain-containing protein [Chroococcidiopsidaceae cyanobacterium CP_BM_RX_35]